MAFVRLLRRNIASILFPAFTAVFIYADWSHTRKWKAQQLREIGQQ